MYAKMQEAQAKQETEEEVKKEDGEEKKAESLEDLALVEAIDASYFSDLKPEDIPDDCVSDVEGSTEAT